MEYKLREDVKTYSDDIVVEELEVLVEEEAAYIRENVPLENRQKLKDTLTVIDGNSTGKCIYGIMFGDCFNAGATEVISNLPAVISDYTEEGLLIQERNKDIVPYYRNFYTPIEHYILPDSIEAGFSDALLEHILLEEGEEYDEEGLDDDNYAVYLERVKKIINLIVEE